MQGTLLRFASTSSLDLAYEQTGPDSGDSLVLLHGWPYSPRSYDGVRDRLAGPGRRILVPYLRGFGPTRYRGERAFVSGQQAALGKDVIDLLDALQVEAATLVGYDWGGRAACVAAALWPRRVRGLLSVDGYAIQDIAKAAVTPKDVEEEHQYWYQWYFQMERGRRGLESRRYDIARKLWGMWSPSWPVDEELFAATAAAFENPEFVATTLHSYRHRYGNAPGDPSLEPLERQLAQQPLIAAPTLVLHGEDDRVAPAAEIAARRSQFTGPYKHRRLPGVGHCPPQETPDAVAEAVHTLLTMQASAPTAG